MCRLGFINNERNKFIGDSLAVASSYYSSSNHDGFGYSYINKYNKNIIFKTEEKAATYWLRCGIHHIVSNNLIFHMRIGTTGEVADRNSHPFKSEDGQYVLMHNGIITNYEEYKKELISNGHIFTSETDSEILLHSFEENGFDMIAVLKHKNVSGYMRLLIQNTFTNELYLYTDSENMSVVRTDNGLTGFSDNSMFEGNVEINNNIFYIIQNGIIKDTIDAGKIARNTNKYCWNNNINYWNKGNYWNDTLLGNDTLRDNEINTEINTEMNTEITLSNKELRYLNKKRIKEGYGRLSNKDKNVSFEYYSYWFADYDYL